MREQVNVFQKEYTFYKDLSERLESRGTQDMQQLVAQLRGAQELEKDLKQHIAELEGESSELGNQNRLQIVEMQAMKRDLKQIMSINEQFQL